MAVQNFYIQIIPFNDNKYSTDKTKCLVLKLGEQHSNLSLKLKNNNADKEYTASYYINEIKFNKQVFEPGDITINISITSEGSLFVDKVFEHAKVSLCQSSTDALTANDTNFIAKEYYILGIQKNCETGKSAEYIFRAYSADKYLTFEKYCKAYTAKTLVPLSDTGINKENVIGSIVEWQVDSSSNKYITACKDKNVYIKTNLQHIANHIIPYCVQYNESFYDFLKRIAGRCGEFLYFEDGVLNIGVAATSMSEEAKTISNSKNSLTTTFKFNYDNVAASHNYIGENFNANEASKENGNSKYYNTQITSDDYSGKIKKDNYVTMDDFVDPKRFAVASVSGVVNQFTLVDAAIIQGVSGVIMSSMGKVLTDKNNDAYNETYFEKDEKVVGSDVQYNSEKKYYRQFSHFDNILNNSFYQKCKEKSEAASRSEIHIELQANSNGVYDVYSLGTKLSVNSKTYIVTRMDGYLYPTTVVDANKKEVSTISETIRISAVEYGTDSIYPPLPDFDQIKESSAQVAVVVANNDPLRIGRVRIKYPWQFVDYKVDVKQTTLSDASPWIRISSPMASDDSGFFFLPEKGDEVMVNYQAGNIDMPYVMGSLYNINHKPSKNQWGNAERAIVSKNGHRIVFKDYGAGMSVFGKIAPIKGVLNSFGVYPVPQPVDKKGKGGIELTDDYGFYSISMSSNDRSIDLKSPYGDIRMNAMTGIVINAPNGDIRITGKNVAIEARNELTLKSGTNINSKFRLWNDEQLNAVGVPAYIGGQIGTLIKNNIIDLSLLRSALETLIRPIGGTMLIKSYRYMCFEAGKGKTSFIKQQLLRNEGLSGKAKAFARDYFSAGEGDLKYETKITDTFMKLQAYADAAYTAAYTAYEDMQRMLTHFKEHYTNEQNRIYETEAESITNIKNGIIANARNANGQYVDVHPKVTPSDQAAYQLYLKQIHYDTEAKLLFKSIQGTIKNKIKESIEDKLGDLSVAIKTAAFNQVCDIYGLNQFFVDGRSNDDVYDSAEIAHYEDQQKKMMKRKFIHKMLNDINVKQIMKIRFNVADPRVVDINLNVEDAENWNAFINCIEYDRQGQQNPVAPVEESTGEKIWGGVKDFFGNKGVWGRQGLTGAKDQYVWSRLDTGDILFSKEANKTLRIGNNGQFLPGRTLDEHTVDRIKVRLGQL